MLRDTPGWTKRASEALAAFVASSGGRLKDQCANLLVIVGYALALPSATVLTLLPSAVARRRFWLALLSEAVRRATESVFKDAAADVDAALGELLDGGGASDATTLSADALAAHELFDTQPHDDSNGGDGRKRRGHDDDDDNAGAKNQRAAAAVSSSAGAASAAKTTTRTLAKSDSALRTLSRVQRHVVKLSPSLTIEEALAAEVAEAARVRLRSTGGGATATATSAKAKEDKWRAEQADAVMLARVAKLEATLRSRLFPSTSATTTLAFYLEAWLALGDSDAVFAQLDSNGGVASVALCDTVKAALVRDTVAQLVLCLSLNVCARCADQASKVRQLADVDVGGVGLVARRRADDDRRDAAAVARRVCAQRSVARQQDGA